MPDLDSGQYNIEQNLTNSFQSKNTNQDLNYNKSELVNNSELKNFNLKLGSNKIKDKKSINDSNIYASNKFQVKQNELFERRQKYLQDKITNLQKI